MNRWILIVMVAALACAQGCARGHRHIDVRAAVGADGKGLDKSPLIVSVKETHRGKHVDFTGLAGSIPGQPGGVRVGIRNTYTSLVINSGWLYIRGAYPYAVGRITQSGGTDASFIIYSEPNRDIIVFLCSDTGAGLDVHLGGSLPQGQSSLVHMPNASTYLVVNVVGGLTTPDPPEAISKAPTEIQNLIQNTKTAVLIAAESNPGIEWCEPD